MDRGNGRQEVSWSRAVKEVQERPRLVMLVSCQSVGRGVEATDDSVLAGLGPRLAEAGVPAVVAMQGN